MHTNLVVSKGQMHWWFGMDLSSYPFSSHTIPGSASQAVLVIPYLVLIAAAMFLQYYQMKQMNSRNPQAAAANPQMQTMQKFFPIIFGVIYLRVPAGATIYMVVSSAMRIGTQEVMFRTGMVDARRRSNARSARRKRDKPPPAAKPEPKPSKAVKKTSTATDGTALAKGTVPPQEGGHQRKAQHERERAEAGGRQAAGQREGERRREEPPAPKPQNRSRSKRTRKAR